MSTLTHSVTSIPVRTPHEKQRVFRGRNMLGFCLITLGVIVPAVSVGRLVWNQQQPAPAPVRWDLLATEASVGGVLTITGFSLIAASTREEVVPEVELERHSNTADRFCASCRATNDAQARYCDQCGVRLG